ncbi:9804_t:CDS:1, partial [Gigaspora rosea]
LTSLAILIAICKEKATIKVNTNSEMVMKIAGKIRDQTTMKMTIIKENLGHLAHAVKITTLAKSQQCIFQYPILVSLNRGIYSFQ